MPETLGFSLPPEQENNTHRIDKLRSKRIQNNYLYKNNCKAIHTFPILIVRLVNVGKLKICTANKKIDEVKLIQPIIFT